MNMIKEFYKEQNESKKNLYNTTTVFDVWKELMTQNRRPDVWQTLEDSMVFEASKEWGPDTIIKFDRKNQIATVMNQKKNRVRILS